MSGPLTGVPSYTDRSDISIAGAFPATNQLPKSSINKSLYPFRAYLMSGESTSELLSVYEIYSHDDEEGLLNVVQPSQSNIPPSKLVFGAGEAEAQTFIKVGTQGSRWVAFDDTDGSPDEGDFVGTKADSYKLSMYKFGFQVIEYNASDGLVLVRPCPFFPMLVKAVSEESGGMVDVQFCDYEGTTYKDAFSVHVLP